MAQTGSFGDISFEASADRIRTWNGWQGKYQARFAEHDVIDGKTKLEATGTDLARIDIDIRLNAAMGVNPEKEVESLLETMNEQEPRVLTMGGKVFGEYVLEDISEQRTHFDARGRALIIRVKLRLREYA
ncbi:MAG: phage tail protein [Desulfosudaceae bacterium]